VLERAGLITRGRDAQYRPCRFEAEPLDSAIGWIEQHRQVWTERFDKLEAHLRTLQQAGSPPGAGRPRQPAKPSPKPSPTRKAKQP
jgi:hypothetical protein